MDNPHPWRPFEPGHPKQGGRKVGVPNRGTILSRAAAARPLTDLASDPACWRGGVPELLEAIARNNNQPIDLRMSAALALIRTEAERKPLRA